MGLSAERVAKNDLAFKDANDDRNNFDPATGSFARTVCMRPTNIRMPLFCFSVTPSWNAA